MTWVVLSEPKLQNLTSVCVGSSQLLESENKAPPRGTWRFALCYNLFPARCSYDFALVVRTLLARCSYEFVYAVRALFVRCSYEYALTRELPRTTRRSWRYRLGVALSIDIPYLRALFVALSLMVQVVASLLFFCLFSFLFFLFPFCLLGNFLSFGICIFEETWVVFAPILCLSFALCPFP